MGSSILLIGAALLLVALNGFFVAAEFGLVKLRQTRARAIAKIYGWRGRILLKVHGQLDAYLSACQLGITLASLGLGWIGEPAFADILGPLLSWGGVVSPEVVHAVSFFVAFFIISFLHIVVGELAPKSMALRLPESIALWTAPPLYVFYWVMYPAIWVLNSSAGLVLRLAGLDRSGGHDAQYSTEELKLILRSSRPAEKLNRDEWNVLAHTLEAGRLDVDDLMRPFNELVALHADCSLEENLEAIAQHRFSRYPYLDGEGRVLGVIHLKSLFLAQRRKAGLNSLEEVLTPIQQVPPEMPAMELFRRFRQGAPHFALVVRKGMHPLGFVTLDDLLSVLVGNIRDEFRQTGNDWVVQEDGTLLGKGALPIFTLERALGIRVEGGMADSVGGLVLEKLGNIPREGERVEFDGFAIVVKKMKGPRILLLRVHPKHTDPGAS